MNINFVALKSEYLTISVIYINDNREDFYDCWMRNFQDMAEIVKLINYSDIESLLNAEYDLILVAIERFDSLSNNVIDRLSYNFNVNVKIILTNNKSLYKYSESVDAVVLTSKNLGDSLNALIWNFFASQFGLGGIDFADIRTVLLSSKYGVLNTYQINSDADWMQQGAMSGNVCGAFTSLTILPTDNINKYISAYSNRNKSLSRDDAVNIIGFPMREKLPRGLEGNVFEITMTS